MFRRRYDGFLGDIYVPEHVQATSTDFDRTKMTALLVLAGMYPPVPVQQWDEVVNWIPIPYDYDKASKDTVSMLKKVHFQPNRSIIYFYQ